MPTRKIFQGLGFVQKNMAKNFGFFYIFLLVGAKKGGIPKISFLRASPKVGQKAMHGERKEEERRREKVLVNGRCGLKNMINICVNKDDKYISIFNV